MRAFIALVLSAFVLSGCFWGDKVEVPPAYVGKVLTKNGYKPETVSPSKFRLDWCWAYCDRLIVMQVADQGMQEEFRLFMPKDQLNMNFDIRFTLSMRADEASITQVFDRVPATDSEGKTSYISTDRVYKTYGQPILREVVRTVVANYSINEVATNRKRINQEIYQAVLGALQGTPMTVTRLAFADLQFPDVIVKAKEAAAENRIRIEKEEAEKQIQMVKLQTELERAKMERNIRRERAESALEENLIFAKSVTKEYLAYKELEVLEALAKNNNSVFVPLKALESLGLQQRLFQKDAPK